jgi:hypothetical protein
MYAALLLLLLLAVVGVFLLPRESQDEGIYE